MSALSTDSASGLTNTLILALTQCQDQVKTIVAQSARIDRLQQENGRLRQRLEDAMRELENARQEPDRDHGSETGHVAEIEELFRKNVEAQAEISTLRKKLRMHKEKANQRLPAPISSPLSLPPTPQAISPKQTPAAVPRPEPDRMNDEHSISPPRKRPRRDERRALQELSTNAAGATHPRASSGDSRRGAVEKKIAAIPLVAEDGEENMSEDDLRKAQKPVMDKENSVYKRLGGLLTAPTPSKTPLSRPKSPISVREADRPSSSNSSALSRISNINHTTTDSRNTSPAGKEVISIDPSPPTSRSTNVRDRSTGKKENKGPEDDEPLSARPLHRLALYHFKPNPKWLDSQGMSYDEFLHGRNGERVRALAETLPQKKTDDELLRDFLGPGSEAKIASLTNMARKNLVAEAKLKHVAQAFGRQRRDYDREEEPPGFWDTHFPATQEERENREKARQMERDEVKRRYDDAKSGHGRWIFADEAE